MLERHEPSLQGKGAALQWAIQKLAGKNYDYIAIIDADSTVNPDFFHELRLALELANNTDVVQARYEGMANNDHSRIKCFAMLGFNVLRCRGRVALGGSAGIMGNGFIISKETLEKVPFSANSIVEDLEYHIRLAEAGISVAFCDSARIYGEMPKNDRASNIQALRWEGGRLGILKTTFLSLLIKSIGDLLKGKLQTLGVLLELMLLPIGYMVIIIAAGLLFPSTQATAIFGLIAIGVYVLGAAKCGQGWSELTILAKVPHLLWRKLMRIPSLLLSTQTHASWNRTPRSKE